MSKSLPIGVDRAVVSGRVLRWTPPAVAVACLLWVLCSPRLLELSAPHVILTPLFLAVWTGTALAVAVTGSRRRLSVRISRVTIRQAALLLTAPVLLGVLVHFHLASPSWIPLFLAAVHGCAVTQRPALSFGLVAVTGLLGLLEGSLLGVRHIPISVEICGNSAHLLSPLQTGLVRDPVGIGLFRLRCGTHLPATAGNLRLR